jgi:hypothetical protein
VLAPGASHDSQRCARSRSRRRRSAGYRRRASAGLLGRGWCRARSTSARPSSWPSRRSGSDLEPDLAHGRSSAGVDPAGSVADRQQRLGEPGERQQRRELGRGVVDDELAVGASGGAGEMREGVERDDVSSESGRVTTVAPRESAGVAVRGAVGQSLGEALFAGGCGMVAALIEPSRRRSALARSRARAPRVP